MSQANNQLTFISAIIDLGRNSWNSFGDIQPPLGYNPNPYTYSKENYLLWFSYYLNFSVPMILFVDEPYWDDVAFICRNAPNIQRISINKDWILKNIDGWKYFEAVKKVMESDSFKKLIGHRAQYPNVTVPHYVTNTYTKLDYVDYAIKNNLFNTSYVAWTDFGIFKDPGYHLTNFKINMNYFSEDTIVIPVLHMPKEMDKDPIYSLTVAPDCFSAGFIGGTPKKMQELNLTFKRIVELFLNAGITDVEQHILIHCYYENPEGFNLLFCKGDYRNIYKILTI